MTKLIRTIFDQLIVIGIILGVAYMMGLLTGFPKGGDTYGYLTKIRLINTYFPHINWNPFWDSGTPFSIWSYPPLPMTATTFIFVRLFNLTAEGALIAMAAVAFCLLGMGLYGFVAEVTGRRLAGLLTVILFVSSPASWNWWSFGNYVRVFGMGFFGLSLWAISAYIKRFLNGQPARGWFLATLVFSSLAFSSHLLIGGITLMVVFLYILFAIPSLSDKIRLWFQLALFPFLAAAYFYLPMFLTGHIGGRFIGINPAFPVPLPSWFHPVAAAEEYSLSWALSLTSIAGFMLIMILMIFKKTSLSRFEKGSIFAFGLFLLGNVVHSSIGFLPFYPETWYIVGFPPITAFALVSCVLAVGVGLFFGMSLPKLFRKGKISGIIILLLIFLSGFNLYSDFGAIKATVRDLTTYGGAQDLSQQVVRLPDPKDYNHRFGTDSGLVADWFTYRYDMPQTRDYFAQGIPYINWQNWMETAIWAWNDNWNETRFLLDWYGTKYVFVTEPHFNNKKFLSNPDDFTVVEAKNFGSESNTFTQYEYLKNKPIVSATNVPTLLVIGALGEYDVFLRSLAQAGLDSRKIIPIFSNKKVDDHPETELKKFNAVFLYNYTYGNYEKMEKLLQNYLKNGGRVMIDTFRGNQSQAVKLPEFFPVVKTQKTDINKDWAFFAKQSQLLENVNLDGFAEASYHDTPWHTSLAPSGSLAAGGEPILENRQGILMATKKVGKGKIVWSGLNFPFHIADKKSPDEIKLFQNLFTWFGFGQENPEIPTSYKFINPEKREVKVLEEAKGILFKETNFMDWQTDKKIYFAGPGFMYVFLEGKKFPQTTVFEYKLSGIENISFIIAALIWFYFAILLFEAIIGQSIITAKLAHLFRWSKKFKIVSGATGWWDKEEE